MTQDSLVSEDNVDSADIRHVITFYTNLLSRYQADTNYSDDQKGGTIFHALTSRLREQKEIKGTQHLTDKEIYDIMLSYKTKLMEDHGVYIHTGEGIQLEGASLAVRDDLGGVFEDAADA